MQQSENIVYLDLNVLIPNSYQPRKTFNEDTINELALSIKEYGVLNPILVREKEDKYEIIAGERRWRAASKAGLDKIPAIIKDIDDAKLAEMALIENLQRENLTPIEEAESYKEILNLTNLTEQKLSELIGKSQPAISNKMRLLNLTPEVKEALNNHRISERHARSLLTVKDSKKQVELLNKVINERLTVKELDNQINNFDLTNSDIKDTIDSIVASLNKKEIEKESDNMNNGNFFPNYNNQEQNNNVNLNTMNMAATPAPTPVVEPTPTPMPTPVEQPMMINPTPTPQPVMPEPIAPVLEPPVGVEAQSPIPEFGVNNMAAPPAPAPVAETPSPANNYSDIPLFATQNVEPPVQMETIPETNNIVEPAPVAPTLPVEETPLFGAAPVEPTAPTPAAEPTPAPTFEVPVEAPTPAMPEDKYTQVKNLLDANGVTYKAYTGETGNCIIIEL